jgi:hypothetical protein
MCGAIDFFNFMPIYSWPGVLQKPSFICSVLLRPRPANPVLHFNLLVGMMVSPENMPQPVAQGHVKASSLI